MTDTPTTEGTRRTIRAVGAAVLESSATRRRRAFNRLRLANGDGTPTVWWAFVEIVVPALIVISVVVLAIVRD
jgi:hypothetical protein